jgi:hypothetical protein
VSVYVDALRMHVRLFRGGEWCHMATDGDLAELHAFARRIGARTFHPHGKHPHYDLRREEREAAIAAGAIEVGAKELVKRCFRRG